MLITMINCARPASSGCADATGVPAADGKRGDGVRSGQIIAAGTPEDICKNPESQTGKYLNAILQVR